MPEIKWTQRFDVGVKPGAVLVIKVNDGSHMRIPVPSGLATITVGQEMPDTHAVGAPELGRPAMGVIENPATQGMKQR